MNEKYIKLGFMIGLLIVRAPENGKLYCKRHISVPESPKTKMVQIELPKKLMEEISLNVESTENILKYAILEKFMAEYDYEIKELYREKKER